MKETDAPQIVARDDAASSETIEDRPEAIEDGLGADAEIMNPAGLTIAKPDPAQYPAGLTTFLPDFAFSAPALRATSVAEKLTRVDSI